MKSLAQLNGYRDLLWMWTLREIRVRYKQSIMGALWALLQPLSLMVVFSVVFSVFVQIPSDGIPYPIFAYAGLLPWTFLATSIAFGVPSLVNNLDLVTRIYFPREILPIGSVAAALLDFTIGALLYLGLALVFDISLGPNLFWLPVLLLVQGALILGVVLFLAALNVFYRDIRFVIPLATQIWFYATPVIYPLSAVPPPWRGLYSLNPMVGLIDAYRRVLALGQSPDGAMLATSAAVAAIVLAAGYAFFKRSERQFADLI